MDIDDAVLPVFRNSEFSKPATQDGKLATRSIERVEDLPRFLYGGTGVYFPRDSCFLGSLDATDPRFTGDHEFDFGRYILFFDLSP